jgi:hypothetical protein
MSAMSSEPRGFPERDWKVFRGVHKIALARYCDRILDEVHQVIANKAESSHDRYLKIYRIIHTRDKELGRAFNDFRCRLLAAGQGLEPKKGESSLHRLQILRDCAPKAFGANRGIFRLRRPIPVLFKRIILEHCVLVHTQSDRLDHLQRITPGPEPALQFRSVSARLAIPV